MAAVNKVLNMVFACEIRGRLRCSAASIGYRGRIRKGLRSQPGHAAVTELLSSEKLSPPPPSASATEAMPTGRAGMRAARTFSMNLRAACVFSSIRAVLCTQRSPNRRESDAPRCSIRRPGDPSVGGQGRKMPTSPPVRRLGAFAHPARLALLGVLHCGPRAAPGPAALALAEPVATGGLEQAWVA
jgi:hypothetical protein